MSFEFRGIQLGGLGGYELTDQLTYNIKWFIDQGLVEHGGYGLYTLAEPSSFFDADEANLHPVADERFVSGIVWEGAGREWVWESGLSVPSGATEPFRVSGVYVNGTFHSQAENGHFAHHIDYQNGRILFVLPQNSDDVIQVEFTRRSVHVGFAEQEDFRLLMLESLKEFALNESPSSTPAREHQIWLPSIFVEVESGEQRGLQLGGGQIKTRFINLHIFADNPSDRNLLMDWLDKQSRKVFIMADLNAVTFPFDEFGDVVPGATNWPDMVDQHPFRKLRIVDGKIRKLDSLNTGLFRAKVTWEVEIDIGTI